MNCPTSAGHSGSVAKRFCGHGTSSHAQTTYLRDCVLGSGGTILKQPLMRLTEKWKKRTVDYYSFSTGYLIPTYMSTWEFCGSAAR
jgi:hypothetical protein